MTTPMAHMPWCTYPGLAHPKQQGVWKIPAWIPRPVSGMKASRVWLCTLPANFSLQKPEKQGSSGHVNMDERHDSHQKQEHISEILWEIQLSFPDHFMGQTQYSLNSGYNRFILQEVTKVHKSSSDFMPFTTGTARSSEYLMGTKSTKIPHLPICIHPPLVTK